ncbi:class I SAM-dependent methyltransferase [Kyrpidia tusciae]
MRPDRLTGATPWHGHIPFAFWLVRQLRPKIIVELGVHAGNSYCAFCQAVERLNMSSACFGVDTWQGDEHGGFYDESVFNELKQYHDPRFGHFSSLLRMTFDEAVELFDDGTVDLLHIDGLHTYEASKHDFEHWKRKLSNRAIVLFHDIEVRDRGFGVWRLWNELQSQYPTFAFSHSYGLGVLQYGSDIPTTVSSLMTSDDNQRMAVQTHFQTLGERVNLLWQVRELSDRLTMANKDLQSTDRLLDQARAIESQLRAENEQLKTDVNRLTSELGAEIDQLKRTVQIYETSTSWRITRPARSMSRVIRRLARRQ